MIPALSVISVLHILLSQVHNTKEEQIYIVILTVGIYVLYFYILKKIFSAKTIPVALITFFALFSFCAYLVATPKLSNDIYRYLWDGLLVKNDFNPYVFVPSDWKLHDLQEENMELYKQVDWKDKFTPYPPVAQYIFTGAHTLYSAFGLIGGKVAFSLPFLLSAIFLYFYFDKKLFAAFILNPILLLEVVGNAHLDGWVLFFMLVGLYLYHQKRYASFSAIWALAILTKIYPIIFVPFFVIDLLRKKNYLAVIISSILGIAFLYLFYLPFIGETLFPITRYLDLPNEQEFNASIYRYTYHFLGKETPGAMTLASKISGILFFVLAIPLLFKRYSYNLLMAIGILYLLCSPIVFPWYTLFLTPIAFMFLQTKEKNSVLLFSLLVFMQGVSTIMYFEPGIYALRELMLNTEYLLLGIVAMFYVMNRDSIPKIKTLLQKNN